MSKQELIRRTAKEVIKKIKPEDIDTVKNSDPIMFHFSLGLWIRNNCIYGHSEFDNYEPDGISQEIIKEIQRILKTDVKP